MLTKGLLWASFVSQTLENASPADHYFMRRNSEQAPAVEPIKKLLDFSPAMRHRALTLAFLLEDLKVRARFCFPISLKKKFKARILEVKEIEVLRQRLPASHPFEPESSPGGTSLFEKCSKVVMSQRGLQST